MKHPSRNQRRACSQRGATTVEMTLIGIPLIFALISIFEISRGMWNYQTLAYAAKEGVRFAVVHGQDCVNSDANPNNCTVTVAQVATVVKQAGVGLDPDSTTLTFQSYGAVGGTATTDATCTISACSSNTSQWPPTGRNSAGASVIRINVKTPFHSALAMFWPGNRPVSFGVVNLSGSSSDVVQF